MLLLLFIDNTALKKPQKTKTNKQTKKPKPKHKIIKD